MKNKRNARTLRPAPAPRKREQETVEHLKASINQLFLAVNGALNITSAALQRRMDEGFRKLEDLLAEMRP